MPVVTVQTYLSLTCRSNLDFWNINWWIFSQCCLTQSQYRSLCLCLCFWINSAVISLDICLCLLLLWCAAEWYTVLKPGASQQLCGTSCSYHPEDGGWKQGLTIRKAFNSQLISWSSKRERVNTSVHLLLSLFKQPTRYLESYDWSPITT